MKLFESIADRLSPLQGGYMLCKKCDDVAPVGDIAENLASGWPTCPKCQGSMEWVTANQTFGYKVKPYESIFFVESPEGGTCFVGEEYACCLKLHTIVKELSNKES